MKFCPNCGNQLDDNSIFCPACGTKTGEPPVPETGKPPDSGTYTPQPSDSGTYTPPPVISGYNQTGFVQSNPDVEYQSAGSPGNQGGYYQPGSAQRSPGSYYQSAPPNYQGASQNYQGAPQNYQGAPQNYQGVQQNQGVPKHPGGSGSNKLLIIIISVIIGLCLIGGGIFVYSKLSGKNNDTSMSDNTVTDTQVTDDQDFGIGNNNDDGNDVKDEYGINEDYQLGGVTDNIDDYEFGSDYNDQYDAYIYKNVNEFLAIFDTETADQVLFAFDDIGLDSTAAKDFYYYGQWLDGSVYSFTYLNSVVDLLIDYDNNVFSVEADGVQVYLAGYGSYWMDDHLGASTHWDESMPDDGYVFYLTDTSVTSYLGINTSYDHDYVVQLIDAHDGSVAMAFYVYGGHSDLQWYMAVPPGDYTIEYAAGVYWHDIDEIFGPDTVYYRADGVYSFYEGEEVAITLDIYGGTGIPSTDVTSEYS